MYFYYTTIYAKIASIDKRYANTRIVKQEDIEDGNDNDTEDSGSSSGTS